MWHIELVKNKYESLEDLYSLLQYVFRLNKTADDSRRANIITDDLTGCLPAMIPDINNPDMVYRLMLFIIQRRHKDTPQLVRHRIVSFQASDCILPQDLIPLARVFMQLKALLLPTEFMPIHIVCIFISLFAQCPLQH